ncbi:malate dehydrogenase (oxaloacetate-decarboxylating) [Paenibacillus sp. UNCCL117]|uniref:NAD-dependent malic enzyme n=1 Tax=unclassified Paenibacillus TaxID=185978 RepID=UPI00088A57E5|nr:MULTISPECIES: NAD-dependent malic enzyme [unclassified Paenibacillus]SDD33393.1 malate dehydrogenase (oxaloacetate-decarboxylating) [Paenibacillus sp. cl123]SFW39577.1 malate dehydrogenase (oxaloacetate-decarboxylating) [Paenibacillus sp. UNCCL117]
MSASTYMIYRLQIDKEQISLGDIAAVIERTSGDIVGIDVISSGRSSTVRDITVNVSDQTHNEQIGESLQKLKGVKVINVSDRTFLVHLGGKIEIASKIPVKNRDDLSRVYTPGVAKVCTAIAEQPSKAYSLTIKRNTIAVVSDGTAVLGLGDIGPLAAMPVMEGKAMLFKEFAGVDAFPICLDTKDPDEIVRMVKAMAPAFGGINLEDISSPRCFEIEERLKRELDIPVFHDDQHGTAVVLLAGLLNALKMTGKQMSDIKVVVNGIGAAGIACSKMLLAAGVRNLIGVDRDGAIHREAHYNNNPHWTEFARMTNPNLETGSLSEVIRNADVFIGVSAPNILKVEDVRSMAKDPIVFAMANPIPEIDPELAKPYVRVMATGRSDKPNQINNVLCFPGIFRGALDCRASEINEAMKLAAAQAIASVVTDEELNETYIIPSVFNLKVVEKVREAVIEAAYRTGVARKMLRESNKE